MKKLFNKTLVMLLMLSFGFINMYAVGKTGPTGPTGPTGAKGAKGATGATGIQGIQGATGATGVQGVAGAAGAKGITGATGATGASGATGPTGVTGTGIAAITVSGDTLKTLLTTGQLQNIVVPTVPGVTGPTGVGVQIVEFSANSLTFALTNGVVDTFPFNPPKGVTGSTGPAGSTGATGPAGSGSGWGLTGNAGTVDGTNFMGTTDNVALNIRVNNKKAGRIEVSSSLANASFGYNSMNANTTGSRSTAMGYNASSSNVSGTDNTAFGNAALNANTASGNTAVGSQALQLNTTGNQNAAVGQQALLDNTTGNYNVASGLQAMQQNTSGSNNVAYGNGALRSNTIESNNTAIGALTLGSQTNNLSTDGGFNTVVGYEADANEPVIDAGTGDATNATAIGYLALANSNQVVLGNSSTLGVYTHTGVFTTSDGRFKKDVQGNVSGLDFIRLLRPVTYHFDLHKMNAAIYGEKSADYEKNMGKGLAAKEKILYSGFIAQEVEQAAKKVSYDFSGISKPKTAADHYSLDYSQFTVPLVKSVQELATNADAQQQQISELIATNTSLQATNATLATQMQQMANRINQFESSLSECCSNYNSASYQNGLPSTSGNAGAANGNSDIAALEQNVPNPFNASTYIKFYLPSSSRAGLLVITDVSGQVLRQYNIGAPGFGKQTIAPSEFAQGTYRYTLYVDGKMIDTKQMVLTK